jgi:pre-mycofactocin synthase
VIGRACLWGLGAAGEPGSRNVLDILRSGIDEALLGLDRASVHDLIPEDVLGPAGFTEGGGRPLLRGAGFAR